MWYKTDAQLAQAYKEVQAEWLVFDGVHITRQSTGISYDYVALKNKMLIAYPETQIDIQIVYQWDEIDFKKENWKILYTHDVASPFDNDDEKIIWAYVVIKNKRWEFLTTLDKKELDKHRKTAKTDYIRRAWYKEMCLKTITKKACKLHFWDIFTAIEQHDNENYDPLPKTDIDEATDWFTSVTPTA